jgi:cyclophilin family peptidyl-prolyl cis-trans isomerase
MKKPSRARRSRTLGLVESLETRALMTIAAVAPLPDLDVSAGSTAATVDLGAHFNDPDGSPDFAIFNTTLGTIPVLLTPSTTPKTVANFENYVGKGAYTNSIVHRSVPGFVWQAGGYQLSSTPSITQTPTDSPVQNEFGASNVRGTIAMAKLGNDPNSATSQFFFNESDSNAANLDNQNGGFTVFGRVVGQSGLAVMDAISSVPVPSPGPIASPLDSAPLVNYNSKVGVQASNLVLINSVTMADEGFSAVSDSPQVARASLQGSNLVVTPIAAGTAKITVVGYGADGSSASQTFVVNVAPGAIQTQNPAPITTAVNPSDVTPISRGALPSSVIAGRRARIQQSVSLKASGAVSQRELVELVLSPTSSAAADVTIASANPNVRLKAGKQARVNLSTPRLDASVPAGTYRVLVSVTDPDGAKTTVDTGKTLVVQPPGTTASRR